ncbi:MAG: hydantoinase B/oxoprolinase family protein [Proteobacteria bacterium]|nr:hydantoinase B/oxoprolinase family protein [Pseudomonadota bacterium]
MTDEGTWQFWIDRGGTFTDVVARRPDGQIQTLKLLSENDQYADASLEGIRRILDDPDNLEFRAHPLAAVKMGTTVATNALLERKGEPLALIITRGFGDALRIGYQNRPDIFAREIVLPDMLYSQVVEIDERVAADGTLLVPLDQEKVQAQLEAVFEQGIQALAIVLMHGYRYPDHEKTIAAIAGRIGFAQISVSHESAPLIRLVSRGDTTVVDAYLTPLLRRYVDRIDHALKRKHPDMRLLFMQSHGGLTEAHRFHGRNSILSGPAGGVVAMAKAGTATGCDRLIAFDMGGTSTDVSLYAGDYERVYETEVAGVRMRAPMMRIETVAAGGGSRLRFRDERLQVGPESAGADPGPACYRRNGPLCVTDANLLLGRLSEKFFPMVFGPAGNQSLDIGATRKAFAKLTGRINAETGGGKSAEEVAEGFLTIAVENMANAIKTVSVQRGHDAQEFALYCFGGAGGQLCCRVADSLGMRRILIHPQAGVLSALGMGLAEIRDLRQQTVSTILDEKSLAALQPLADRLTRQSRAAVAAQQAADKGVQTRCQAQLRYQGSDSVLPVPWSDPATMKNDFASAHREHYGFSVAGQAVVIENLAVESIGDPENIPPAILAASPLPDAVAQLPFYCPGGWRTAAWFDRVDLGAGCAVDGPAVIFDDSATTVVDPGWRARVLDDGHLQLERSDVQVKPADDCTATGADPIMLEVFNNLFMHIATQMGVVLRNTAHSVNIKERLDFSCALFDEHGGLVANAPHMPVHLGSMGDSVATVVRKHAADMRPGDSFALNAPYAGGTHLPDITVVTPAWFDRAKPVFYLASRAHHADIGGITPGSMPPDSTRIEQEGTLLDNLRIVRDGQLDETRLLSLLTGGEWPARNPQQNIEDLKAQVAANRRGLKELGNVIDHYGLATVQAYVKHVQDNAEESVRRAIGHLKDGKYSLLMDTGQTIQVAICVDQSKRSAIIDFAGTSPQAGNNFNAPASVCTAAVLYVFRTLVDHKIPLNEGCLKPLAIKIPAGSMLAPAYPAAVVAGNVETSQCIVDALYGALNLQASAQGTMNNLTFGDSRWQYYETICGGSGAGDGFHGTDAIHTHMTNSRLTDPEVLESRFPVRVREFSIRKNSGGDGKYRGGNGAHRSLEFLQAMTVAILSGHRKTAPSGLAGGADAAAGRNSLQKANGDIVALEATASFQVEPGDVLVIDTPGGGGYGIPDRDAE